MPPKVDLSFVGPYVCHSIGVESYVVAFNCLVDDTLKLDKVMRKLARKISQQQAIIRRYEELDRQLGF